MHEKQQHTIFVLSYFDLSIHLETCVYNLFHLRNTSQTLNHNFKTVLRTRRLLYHNKLINKNVLIVS